MHYSKIFHPVLALQARGKIFLTGRVGQFKEQDWQQNLSQNKKHAEYVNDIIDMIRNSIGICITYSRHSTYNFDRLVDENLERGLVMRILWSYFFNNKN